MVQCRCKCCRSMHHIRLGNSLQSYKYSSILHHFLVILTLNNIVTLKSKLRSYKVIGHDSIDHTSSYSSVLYCFRNKARSWSKNANFFISLPLNLHDHQEVLVQTAHVHKLLYGAEILPKSSISGCGPKNVTDRQSDL